MVLRVVDESDKCQRQGQLPSTSPTTFRPLPARKRQSRDIAAGPARYSPTKPEPTDHGVHEHNRGWCELPDAAPRPRACVPANNQSGFSVAPTRMRRPADGSLIAGVKRFARSERCARRSKNPSPQGRVRVLSIKECASDRYRRVPIRHADVSEPVRAACDPAASGSPTQTPPSSAMSSRRVHRSPPFFRRTNEQLVRHGEAEHPSRLGVDDQLNFEGLHHRRSAAWRH